MLPGIDVTNQAHRNGWMFRFLRSRRGVIMASLHAEFSLRMPMFSQNKQSV